MLRTIAVIVAILAPLAWLAVAGVGLWSFLELNSLGEFTADGTPRTWADKALPYVFLLLVPIGLRRAWMEYTKAKAEIPLMDAEDERNRQMRRRQKAAQSRLRERYPVSEHVRVEMLAALNKLRRGGVLAPDDVDNERFIGIAEQFGIEEGGLYEVSSVLMDYALTYGPLSNCLAIPDQVEVFDADIVEMIEGFARLAGRGDTLGPVTVKMIDARARPPLGEAVFTLDGAEHTLRFDYPGKNASGALMERLADLFDTGERRFAAAYFDSVFLIAFLTTEGRNAMNAQMDEEFELFEWLRQ